MNKTVIFIVIAVLALFGIIGAGLILVFRPDASATFIGYTLTLLALIVSAAGTIYALGKQSDQLKQIESQTNGQLTSVKNEKAALEAQLLAFGQVPLTASRIGEHTATASVPTAPVLRPPTP